MHLASTRTRKSGTRPSPGVHPHFPFLRELDFQYWNWFNVSTTRCVIFGNTDQVHLACKQESMGWRCWCAHGSVKCKQMQLVSIRPSWPWIDDHGVIQCLLCHIKGRRQWHLNGKTTGSRASASIVFPNRYWSYGELSIYLYLLGDIFTWK